MLPKATLRTRTIAPDGKAIYEDESEIQQSRIPVFEGMLHAQTLAPILAARRNALEVAGVHVVESETIATEAVADIDRIEGQLAGRPRRWSRTRRKTPPRRWRQALVRGVEFRFRKDDKELASARDAIWLARRSLEENNPTQAFANLEVAQVSGCDSTASGVHGSAPAGGRDASRGRATREPAPLGGDPDRQPRRTGPPEPPGDAVVGQGQRLVPPAFLIAGPGPCHVPRDRDRGRGAHVAAAVLRTRRPAAFQVRRLLVIDSGNQELGIIDRAELVPNGPRGMSEEASPGWSGDPELREKRGR